jgi:hypothetical protein
MKRVQESAPCIFCARISRLYDEVELAKEDLPTDMVFTAILRLRRLFKPRNTDNVASSVLEFMGVKQPQDLSFMFRSITISWSDAAANSKAFWPKVIHANYAFHQYDIQNSPSPSTFFKDETIPDDKLLLCGGRVTKSRV